MKKEIEKIYGKLVELQSAAWRNDDIMDQETLAEIQEKIAVVTLDAANAVGKSVELMKKFPWLYKVQK